MSRRLLWRSSCFLTMIWSWRTCLKSSFSKCKCPGGYNGDPHVFDNVLVIRNMLEIHFSKCKCPGGYNGDPHVFCQCSGHEEHAWNQLFQNVNVPAATMAILTFFDNVLVMKNMSEINFSGCDTKFFYKTAESLEKRRQIWILWSYKNIVEEAKNVHFLK